MSEPNTHNSPPPSTAFPLAGAVSAVDAEELKSNFGVDNAGRDLPRVSGRWILLLVLAVFGAYIAFVTPIAISLAIRVKDLAPNNEEYLGFILGAGSVAALIFGPLGGQLSDRTRTRWGRRRPWLIGGTLLGLVALATMGTATSILILGIGWIVAQIGFSQVLNNLTTIQADKLPEFQRGKVAGLTGFASMAAPVFGAIIGGTLASQSLLLFLIPGIIALVLVLLFAVLVHEDDSRDNTFDQPLTVKTVVSKYLFNPRRHPDFSWNWLGRFLFYFGLTLNTTYTAFFFASRLGLPVTEVGGIVAIVGLVGIVGTMGGALGSGFISDKLQRRKPFVLVGGSLFALGAVIMAFAPDMPLLIAGSFLTNLGIGIFSAVDQALLLDVLPERETDAGRFVSITQFATTIPQALAPIVASMILAIGTSAAMEKNYPLLYIAGAVFTILGGLVILRVKAVR
jgi:MFS family permease